MKRKTHMWDGETVTDPLQCNRKLKFKIVTLDCSEVTCKRCLARRGK